MITKLLVIQNVKENGNVEVIQITSNNFQWTFEKDRARTHSDKAYFPFKTSGIVNVIKREPGSETKTTAKANQIIFIDDYGIPEGSVIGILLPPNFIPDIIKFKDKPYIPAGLVGQVSTHLPGQIQILYNKADRRCAIVLHIHERLLFGIKCIAKKVASEYFPENGLEWADELFDISISRKLLNIDVIRTDDLKIINESINQTDLIDLNNTLNEILIALKAKDKVNVKTKIAKVGDLILKSSSLASNITRIINSYNEGGVVHQFVGKVLEYSTL